MLSIYPSTSRIKCTPPARCVILLPHRPLLRQTLIPALFLTSIVRCKRSRTAVRQDQAISRTTRCSPSRRRRSPVPTHALTSRERTTTSSPPVPIVNCRRDIYIARRARLPRHSTRPTATNHYPRLETRTRTRSVEETRR